jgi:hypothetical protein
LGVKWPFKVTGVTANLRTLADLGATLELLVGDRDG